MNSHHQQQQQQSRSFRNPHQAQHQQQQQQQQHHSNNNQNPQNPHSSRQEQPPLNNNNNNNNNGDEEQSVKPTESVSDDGGESNTFNIGGVRRGVEPPPPPRWKSPHLWFAVICLVSISLIIGLSLAAANNAKDQPAESFELRFDQYSVQVEEVLQTNLNDIMERFQAWSTLLTQQVQAQDVTSWPFATIDHMEALSDTLQNQTGVGQISFHPIVQRGDRINWERYVSQNFGNWMRESYSFRDIRQRIPELSSDVINHGLFAVQEATSPVPLDGIKDEDEFYLPYWQLAPLVDAESLIMFDALKFDFVRQNVIDLVASHAALERTKQQKLVQPVLSNAVNLQPLVGEQPESVLAVPILDKDSEDLVAIFVAVVPWSVFFQNLKPAESLHFVTSPVQCSGDGEEEEGEVPGTTYQVEKDGSVSFVGVGAFNENTFDGIPVKLDGSFHWVDGCQPEFTVYPTPEYEEEFLAVAEPSESAVPIVILGIVLLVILAGGYCLVLYNSPNRRKQRRKGNAPPPMVPPSPLKTMNRRGTVDDNARNMQRLGSLDPNRRAVSFSSGHNNHPSRAGAPPPSTLEPNRFLPAPPLDIEEDGQNSMTGSLEDFSVPINDSEEPPGRPQSYRSFHAPTQPRQDYAQPAKPQSFSSSMSNSNSSIQFPPPAPGQPSQRKRASNSNNNTSTFRGQQPGSVRVDGAGMLISESHSHSPMTPHSERSQSWHQPGGGILRYGNASNELLSMTDHSPMRSSSPSGNSQNPLNYQMRSSSPVTRTSTPMVGSANIPMQLHNNAQGRHSTRTTGRPPQSDLAAVVAQREEELRNKAANNSSNPGRAPSPQSRPASDLTAVVAQREQELRNKAANNSSNPGRAPSPNRPHSVGSGGNRPTSDLAAVVAQREQQLRDKAANNSSNPTGTPGLHRPHSVVGSRPTSTSSNPARAPSPNRPHSTIVGVSRQTSDLAEIIAQREQQLRDKTINSSGNQNHSTNTSNISDALAPVQTPALRRTRTSTRRQMMLQDISRQNVTVLTRQDGAEQIKDSEPEIFDKPIADHFPNCTIMFADLVGFTSWSSVREPTQVFNLLESLYNAFDRLAKQRGVFKVVTIGDCYVAATGVPKARKDHAVAMARFAKECMITMKKIFEKLKSQMGEDTLNLGMRFGLNSGPVTGGVVRGDKSQFQLFGDTMNTAAKVESSGEKNKIHVSETTALHIMESGREKWLEPREKPLKLDGKSLQQTYWIMFGTDARSRFGASSGHLSFSEHDLADFDFDDDDLDDFEYDQTDIDTELIAQLMKDVGNAPDRKNQPLASKYMNCTIFFGEVDGFIPWSAEKEPYQVFMLLEALFKAFDKIAKRRKIFKVETIADCYVAAAGTPYRRDDHAVAMAVFAHECLLASGHVVSELANTLGSGSKDLGMRFGLHSGSVTAGVLRGEKCRFQLFGDTMNTASRMESNGTKGKIQLSETTANLIRDAGRGKWLVPREEKIQAKGKGMMQTYWLEANVRVSSPSSGAQIYSASYGQSSSMGGSSDEEDFDEFADDSAPDVVQSRKEEKMYGMIDATVDIFERLMKKIVAKRGNVEPTEPEPEFKRTTDIVIQEMADMIELPSGATQFKISPAMVRLKEPVLNQLRDFVSVIAFMYSDIPFHSFEHASFVVESANRIISRTVAPQNMEFIGMTDEDKLAAKNMKEYSNKIRSDPLTQFAMVFAALIHGLQHPGVSYEDISNHCTDLAIMYNNRCVVEQNAIDTAWDMFMEPQFADLRACIYRTQEELERFRQLVVNCVIGSNLFDSELKFGRNKRWKKAFVVDETSNSSFDFSLSSLDAGDDMNLKATVAIEHIMQGAMWSHTMQRFEVYLKWNERLYHENAQAFKKFLVSKDRSTNWFYSQLRFLDSYAIPLASRLVETELFGYNGEEYLRNAKRNRQEWELKGRELVNSFMSKGDAEEW